MRRRSSKSRSPKSKRELKADLNILAELGRRTVEQAWKIGEHLNRAKLLVEHGEWTPWLEKHGVKDRTARVFMQIRNNYQISQLCRFGSLDAALKGLPSPDRNMPDRPDNELSNAEMRLVERDNHIERIKSLEKEIQAKAVSLDVAQKKVQAFDSGSRPKLAANLAKIDEMASRLRSCIAEREKQAIVLSELRKERKS